MTDEIKAPVNNINKIFIILGVVLVLAVGVWAYKSLMPTFDYDIMLVNAPVQIEEGKVATFTWKIEGNQTNINHTAVYFGKDTQPGNLGKDVKPEGTKYTDLVKDFDNGEYAIPLIFVGNATGMKQGEYFFRIHALINGKNYWSDEYSFKVDAGKYRVALLNAPAQIVAGNTVTFTWDVDGPATIIKSAAVYYGTESVSGILGKEVKPQDTKYNQALTDFVKGDYQIPLRFVGNVKITQPGTYYFRVYAQINGENYWSDEGTFSALEPKGI